MSYWLTIGISGVTCGGKSTLSQTLYDFLSSSENSQALHRNIQIDQVKIINQDDYFLPVDHHQHTWIERLNHINWEILSSLDIEKMCEDISSILGSNYRSYNVRKPMTIDDKSPNFNLYFSNRHSNFNNHQPQQNNYINNSNNNHHPNTLNQRHLQELPIHLNILILEGILILNHHYTLDLCDVKFHMHLPYEKCYERRKNRVYDPADVTGYFEMCVWPQYEKNFKEIKDRNDVIKLNGEIPRDQLFRYVLKCIKNAL